MAAAETISLRDAGAALAGFTKTSEKVASGTLLRLLQSSKIKAGIHLPLSDNVLWIELPERFWLDVTTNKFKVIRYSRGDEASGAFKIHLSVISNEVTAQGKALLPVLGDQVWVQIVAAGSDAYEVKIMLSDWEHYKKQFSAPERVENRGRKKKEGWEEVYSRFAGYLVNHYQKEKNPERVSADAAASHVLKVLERDGVGDLPAEASIRDKFRSILNS